MKCKKFLLKVDILWYKQRDSDLVTFIGLHSNGAWPLIYKRGKIFYVGLLKNAKVTSNCFEDSWADELVVVFLNIKFLQCHPIVYMENGSLIFLLTFQGGKTNLISSVRQSEKVHNE